MAATSNAEPEPLFAVELFGDRIDFARRFAADLVEHGERLGLIGPLEAGRIWTRHIVNSVLVAPLLPAGARVGDVGSGAGLPGLVLAVVRPDLQMLLIEPMERRVEWLTAEADRLELRNVSVLASRAEDVRLDVPLDAVTARAVSALSKLLPLVVPIVRSNGRLLLMKGARVDAEVEAARKVIRRLRLVDVEVLTLGEGVATEPTRVFSAVTDYLRVVMFHVEHRGAHDGGALRHDPALRVDSIEGPTDASIRVLWREHELDLTTL